MPSFVSLAAAAALAAAPLTLPDALSQAEAQSLDLEIARARLTQAEQLSAKAWAGYLPSLSVGASYTRNNVEAKIRQPTQYAIRRFPQETSPQDIPPPEEGVATGVPTDLAMLPVGYAEVVIQPLDALNGQAQLSQALVAPALIPAIHSAGLAGEAARLNTEAARREVLFAVAQSYYAVATLQQTLQVTEKLLEVARAHEKDARLKVEAGAANRLTLLRAELDRSRAEQDVVRTRNALASARLGLATLLNRDADFEVVPPPEPQVPPELAAEGTRPAEALEARPDVAAARTSQQAAEAGRTGTYLGYLPTLGLGARYNVSNAAGFAGSNSTWAVSLGLNWTLWDGGLREAQVREASARVVEARAVREQAERRVRDELAKARLDLESAQANRLKAEDSARLARETAALAELTFQHGASTYLEVSDANAALAQAEVGLLSETLNAQLAALRLLKAAGLWAAPR